MFGINPYAIAAYAGAAIICAGTGAATVGHFYYRPKLDKITLDLRDARTAAIGERAARETVTRLCDAGNTAASTADDLRRAAQDAIDRATQELRNAPTDDADPLRNFFDGLREPGPAALGTPSR